MTEYIEREAAEEAIYDAKEIDSINPITKYNNIYYALQTVPAADVVEVVHGEWIEEIIESYIPLEWDESDNLIVHHYKRYRCSLCGRVEGKEEPYCNCGAKMNGKRRSE